MAVVLAHPALRVFEKHWWYLRPRVRSGSPDYSSDEDPPQREEVELLPGIRDSARRALPGIL